MLTRWCSRNSRDFGWSSGQPPILAYYIRSDNGHKKRNQPFHHFRVAHPQDRCDLVGQWRNASKISCVIIIFPSSWIGERRGSLLWKGTSPTSMGARTYAD